MVNAVVTRAFSVVNAVVTRQFLVVNTVVTGSFLVVNASLQEPSLQSLQEHSLL